MFIALEGVDGSGKSTLCSILAERLGAISYSTPPKKYLAFREQVDKNASKEEHYRFYRDGIYDASNEIGAILKNNGKVVSDRYWLSTYTYHQVMGVPVSMDDFSHIIMPTMTIILSLNSNIQISRMLCRGMTVGDRKMLDQQQEIAVAFYQNVLKNGIPFLMIDTQCFSPKECTEIIIKAVVN